MSEFETQVLAELRGIRALLERREAGESSLLRVIHAYVGDAEFSASELAKHAALPRNTELRAALAREFESANPRRIGRFLASTAGRPMGGFIAESVGEDRDGIIWRVRVAEGKHALPVAHEESAAHAGASFEEGVRKCV